MGTYCGLGEFTISESAANETYTIRVDVIQSSRNKTYTEYRVQYATTAASSDTSGNYITYNTTTYAPSSVSITIPKRDIQDKYISIRISNMTSSGADVSNVVKVYGQPSRPQVSATKQAVSNKIMWSATSTNAVACSKGYKIYRQKGTDTPDLIFEGSKDEGATWGGMSYEDRTPPAATDLAPIYYQVKLVSNSDLYGNKENLSDAGTSRGITPSRKPYAPIVSFTQQDYVVLGQTEYIEMSWQFNSADSSRQSKAVVRMFYYNNNEIVEVVKTELGEENYYRIDLTGITTMPTSSLFIGIQTWGIDQSEDMGSDELTYGFGVVYPLDKVKTVYHSASTLTFSQEINDIKKSMLIVVNDSEGEFLYGSYTIGGGRSFNRNLDGVATIYDSENDNVIATITSDNSLFADSNDRPIVFPLSDEVESKLQDGEEYYVEVEVYDNQYPQISTSSENSIIYDSPKLLYAPSISGIENMEDGAIRISIDLFADKQTRHDSSGQIASTTVYARYFSVYVNNGEDTKIVAKNIDILNFFPAGTNISDVYNSYEGSTTRFITSILYDFNLPDLDTELDIYVYAYTEDIVRSDMSNHVISYASSHNNIIINHGDRFENVDTLKKNATYSTSNEKTQAKYNVVGKEHPVVFFGEQTDKQISVSASVDYPDEAAHWDYLSKIMKTVYMRAPGGFSHRCSVDNISISKPKGIGSATLSMSLTVVDDE